MPFGPPSPGPIVLRLGDEDHQLDPAPTRVWLDALTDAQWTAIIPGMLTHPHAWEQRLLDPADRLNLFATWQIALAVAEHTLGVPWHIACRLAQAAAGNWLSFDGWCARRALNDLNTVTPSHVLAAVNVWLMESCADEKAWTRLTAKLQAPPEYANLLATVAPWAGDDEAALFQAAMAGATP